MPAATKPYGNNIPTARPMKRVVDIRSLSYGLSGAEQPYPVYQFSGNRVRWEYPAGPKAPAPR